MYMAACSCRGYFIVFFIFGVLGVLGALEAARERDRERERERREREREREREERRGKRKRRKKKKEEENVKKGKQLFEESGFGGKRANTSEIAGSRPCLVSGLSYFSLDSGCFCLTSVLFFFLFFFCMSSVFLLS